MSKTHGLPVTPVQPLEFYSNQELIRELSRRYKGFIFAGYFSSRLKGEYPDQVYADTDLPTLAEISELGDRFFNICKQEHEFDDEDD